MVSGVEPFLESFFGDKDFHISTVCFLRRSKSQEHRDSPAIIGSDTPVNPEDLMFADLRSGTVGDETWNNRTSQVRQVPKKSRSWVGSSMKSKRSKSFEIGDLVQFPHFFMASERSPSPDMSVATGEMPGSGSRVWGE